MDLISSSSLLANQALRVQEPRREKKRRISMERAGKREEKKRRDLTLRECSRNRAGDRNEHDDHNGGLVLRQTGKDLGWRPCAL
jgi:hypothetical protein